MSVISVRNPDASVIGASSTTTSLNSLMVSAPGVVLAWWMAQANELAVVASPQRPWVTSKLAAETGRAETAVTASRARATLDRLDMDEAALVLGRGSDCLLIHRFLQRSVIEAIVSRCPMSLKRKLSEGPDKTSASGLLRVPFSSTSHRNRWGRRLRQSNVNVHVQERR